MLKQKITYKNYNDVEVTEDFYFNLTKAEITKLELNTVGGFTNKILKCLGIKDVKDASAAKIEDMSTESVPLLADMFEEVILAAYAKKLPTGELIKSEELKQAFKCSEAYSVLFMELLTNPDKANDFISGVFPVMDETDKKAIPQK